MPSPFDHLAIPSAPYRRPLSVRLVAAEGPPQQPPEEQLEKILEEKEKTQPLKPVSVEVAPEAGHEMAAAAKRQLLERIRGARPPVSERISKIVDSIMEKAVTIEPEVPVEVPVKKEEGAPYYERLKAQATDPKEIARLDRIIESYRPKEEPKPLPVEVVPSTSEQSQKKVGDIVTEGKTRARVLEVNAAGRPTRLETIDDVPVPKPPEKQPRRGPLDRDSAAREHGTDFGDEAEEVEAKETVRRAGNTTSPPPERPPVPEQNPAPAEVVRPQREQITFGSLLRDQVEHVMQKVPGRAWLDTLGPRMQALYHRQFATVKAMQQEKAQGKLNLAKDKAAYYADAVEHSGGALKLIFGNRLRKWQGREETLRAKVNTLDAYRTRRTERHTALQQRIAERYERETVPYQERIADLKKKKEAILDAKKKLEQKRADAIKLVTAAKAKPPGFFDFTGRASLARLERMVTNADRDIARADKHIDVINAPLAKAEAKFQKFDARRKIAVSMMKL